MGKLATRPQGELGSQASTVEHVPLSDCHSDTLPAVYTLVYILVIFATTVYNTFLERHIVNMAIMIKKVTRFGTARGLSNHLGHTSSSMLVTGLHAQVCSSEMDQKC